MSLSDKIYEDQECCEALRPEDVKEFIEALKMKFDLEMTKARRRCGIRNAIDPDKIINELAGDKLI